VLTQIGHSVEGGSRCGVERTLIHYQHLSELGLNGMTQRIAMLSQREEFIFQADYQILQRSRWKEEEINELRDV